MPSPFRHQPSPFRQQPSPFKQRARKSRTEPSSLEDSIQFCPCRGCERPCNTFGRSHLRLGPRNCGADHSQTARRGRRHKLHHVGRYGGVCVRYCGHIASPPRLAERCGRLSAGVSLPAHWFPPKEPEKPRRTPRPGLLLAPHSSSATNLNPGPQACACEVPVRRAHRCRLRPSTFVLNLF